MIPPNYECGRSVNVMEKFTEGGAKAERVKVHEVDGFLPQ